MAKPHEQEWRQRRQRSTKPRLSDELRQRMAQQLDEQYLLRIASEGEADNYRTREASNG